ncbi:MAG: hypothetical protein Q7U92_24410, partial [Bradyrhizobium sp.]|nr:hypothetical protein [Bradyrhizobium sp.]
MIGSIWPGSAGPLLMTGQCLNGGDTAVTSVTQPDPGEIPRYRRPVLLTIRRIRTAGFSGICRERRFVADPPAKIVRPTRRRWWGVKTSFALMGPVRVVVNFVESVTMRNAFGLMCATVVSSVVIAAVWYWTSSPRADAAIAPQTVNARKA